MLSPLQYDEFITGFPPARLCLSLLLLQCDFGTPCPYNFKCGVLKTRVASKTSETTSASWWLLSNLSSLPSAIKHQNIFMFWASQLFGQSHRFSNTIVCLAHFVSALHLTLPKSIHAYKTWCNPVPWSMRCILAWGQAAWNGTISTRSSMLSTLSTLQYDELITGIQPARVCVLLLLLQGCQTSSAPLDVEIWAKMDQIDGTA